MTESDVTQPDAGHLGWRIRLLLGCYPPWWRTRYDDEMRDTVLALRAEGRWTAAGGWDLLRGVVAAWFAPDPIAAEGTMTDPTRRQVPRTAFGVLLFMLAGAAFAKVVEDPSFNTAARHHAVLGWSVGALRLAALATALLLVVALACAVVAILLRRPPGHWRDLLPLLAPPASALAFLLTLAAVRPLAQGTSVHATRHLLAFGALALVTVAGGVATSVALARVAMRAPETPVVRATRRLAIVGVGVLTVASALAVVSWLLATASQAPDLLRASDGLVATPTWVSLLAIVVALFAAAALCGQSARTAAAGRRTG